MKWTKEEIVQFDDLIESVGSQNQLERISGRYAMQDFVNSHGRPKCDAMWAHLESGGDKSEFDDGAET